MADHASDLDPHGDHHAAGSGVDAYGNPPEQPSEWGWNHDFGKLARIGGWVSVISLLLMITSTHYNGAGAVALIATAAVIAIGLGWDIHRRRTAWRR